MLETKRGFWKTVLFNIITLGIYGLYLLHVFAKETNVVCAKDGKNTSGLLVLILLGIVTAGIYDIIWMVLIIDRRATFLQNHKAEPVLTVKSWLLTQFLFGWLTLGIMYLVVYAKFIGQQNAINAIYNQKAK